MFDTTRPYIKGSTLEIGSGIGNISDMFIQQGMPLYLSDLEDKYCRILSKRFLGEPMVRSIFRIDLRHPDFGHKYAELLGRFSTVFALNVVEHIPNDKLAIANAKLLLRKRGHLIVLVPAYMALYNGLDLGLEHWRRYNRQSIRKLLSKDFEILKVQYFNMVGILGWWLSGSALGKKELPEEPLSFYNKLVPMFQISDAITFKQVGLSVIAVGKRN
ncbi:MAG: class I SAM-dependent methyltransferase [Puia sp.]|nr:class I SAM-dependent methyltransferase [Puia sp.]